MSLKVDSSVTSREPTKRSALPRGCWIALIVTGVLGLLSLVAIVVAVVMIARNPEVRRIGRLVGGSVRLMNESQRGPGAAAVRRAGCDRAMVLDVSQIEQLARELDEDPGAVQSAGGGSIVICQFVRQGSPPSCDAVAAAFSGAAPPQPEGFTVTVQAIGQGGNACASRYGPDGRLVERLDAAAGPQLPMPAQPAQPAPAPQVPTPQQQPLLPNPFDQ